MSLRYPGGLITKNPVVPSTSSAAGIWTLEQALEYIKAGTWPSTGDPYFEYVTMLLHGDGTNGAQNNTFLDSSTNNFTITRNGNTTQGSFSPFSRANGYWSNYFDGTGDYLSVADNAAFELGTGNFTAECFVYLSNVSSGPFVFGQWESSSGSDTNSSFLIYVSASKFVGLVAYGNSTSQVSLTGTTTLTNGTWYHVALVRNGTSLTLYVNGVQEATSTTIGSSTVNNSNLSVIVGGRTGGTSLVTGYISNARIVKGTAVYTSAFTPPNSPLTAITNTSLLTCQSNRFIDNSTNAFAITRNGDTSVQVFSPFNPTIAYSTTTNGGSGYFDGSGDYLSIANNAAFQVGTGDFSLEGWFYTTSTAVQAPFGTLYSGTTDYLLTTINRNSAGSNVSGFVQGGINDAGLLSSSSAVFSINQWNHLVLCRSGTTLSIFVNGSRVATGTNSSSSNSTQAFQVGDNTGLTRPFFGYINGVRLVKGSSPYDATQTTITIPTAPLTAITNTSLLLNFTNGGIFDNAAMNDLETVGNTQISTAQSKFGGGSMYFDGTGDLLQMPATQNVAFGTGDFTIEFWMYSNSVSGVAQPGMLQTSNVAGGLSTSYTTGIVIAQGVTVSGGTPGGGDGALATNVLNTWIGSTSTVITTGTWYHVAVTRASGVVRLFVNGVSNGSATVSGSIDGQNLCLGSYYSTSYPYNGYLDDFRITKGYARYTANFTPPIAPFADK